MSNKKLTVVAWLGAIAAIILFWAPLSCVRSGNQLELDIDVVPSLALIIITVAAWMLYRRLGRAETTSEPEEPTTPENGAS